MALRIHRDQAAKERKKQISEFNAKYDAAIIKHGTEVAELRNALTVSEKAVKEKDGKIVELMGVKADLEKSLASARGDFDSTLTELTEKLHKESENVSKLQAARRW